MAPNFWFIYNIDNNIIKDLLTQQDLVSKSLYFIKLTSLNGTKYELIQIRLTGSSFRGGGIAFPTERWIS